MTSFEAIATTHLDAAYRLARWLTRDSRLAEDVVQDAMVRALTYFSSFRGDNPRAWRVTTCATFFPVATTAASTSRTPLRS